MSNNTKTLWDSDIGFWNVPTQGFNNSEGSVIVNPTKNLFVSPGAGNPWRPPFVLWKDGIPINVSPKYLSRWFFLAKSWSVSASINTVSLTSYSSGETFQETCVGSISGITCNPQNIVSNLTTFYLPSVNLSTVLPKNRINSIGNPYNTFYSRFLATGSSTSGTTTTIINGGTPSISNFAVGVSFQFFNNGQVCTNGLPFTLYPIMDIQMGDNVSITSFNQNDDRDFSPDPTLYIPRVVGGQGTIDGMTIDMYFPGNYTYAPVMGGGLGFTQTYSGSFSLDIVLDDIWT